MNGTALGCFLIAGGFAVFLGLGFADEVPLAAGYVGGILLFIGLFQLLRDAERHAKAHRALVIVALVLGFVGGFLFRFVLRNDPTTPDEVRTYFIAAVANDTILTLAPFLALFMLARLPERALLGFAVVATLVSLLLAYQAMEAWQETFDPQEEERHLADMDLWAMVANVAGNVPVILAGILCGVRHMKDPAAVAAPHAAPTMRIAAVPPPQAGPATPPPAARAFTPSVPAAPPAPGAKQLTCPRCKATVAKPAAGPPTCPTCGYPKPDTRARPA